MDFDDGHCPTWSNTLRSHKNVMDAVRGRLQVPSAGLEMAEDPALLLVRPRAWNMDETVCCKLSYCCCYCLLVMLTSCAERARQWRGRPRRDLRLCAPHVPQVRTLECVAEHSCQGF